MPSDPEAQGRRRGRRGRGCLVALAAVVLLAGLVAVLRQPLGRFGVGVAVRLLARGIDGEVEYERIEGDLFGSPTIVGLVVRLNGDSLRVARVSVRYSPAGFLYGRIPVSKLELVRPELFLAELPVLDSTAGTDDPEPLNLPRLDLELLALTDARVYLRDTLRIDSFNLIAAGRSDRASARVELRSLQGLAVQEGFALRSGAARVRLSPRTLLIEQLELRTDRSRLSGNARLELSNGGLALELSDLTLDLSEFSGIPGLGPDVPRGLFRLRGSAEYSESRQVAELTYSVVRPEFGGVRLPDLAGTLELDQTLLRLAASGRDSALGSFTVSGELDYEKVTYRGGASLRGFRPAGLNPALPDFGLDLDLTVSGTGLDPVRLDASGRVPALGIDTFRLAGSRRGERFELSRFDASGRSGRVQASGSGHTGGRFRGECLFDEFDIAPFARLAGIEASGRLDGLVRGEGSADSLAVGGGLRLTGFSYETVEFEAGVVELDLVVGRELQGRFVVGAESVRLGEQRLDVVQLTLLDSDFDLRVDRSEDRLNARGSYQLGRERLQLEVSGFSFAAGRETLALARPFAVEWSAELLAVRGVRYELADGVIELDAVRVGAASPELTVAVRGLDLARLQGLLGLDFEMAGNVDLALSGRDTLACELTVTGLELPGIGLELRHAALEARYSEPRLTVDRLWMVSNVDTSTIVGRVEFATEEAFRPVEVDLAAELADPGSWVLFFIKDIIDLRAGLIYGSLAAKGDPEAVELSGRLRVSQGQLWVPATGMLIERLNVEVTAGNGRVNVEKASGAAGTGVITAEGFVQLGPGMAVDSLRFDIRFDDAVARPLPEVHLVASGGIVLTQSATSPLSVEGTVIAREALLTFGFGRESPAPPPDKPAKPVLFDIRVRAERGIWLRNRVADIELSVDLSVKQTLQDQTWTGQLTTRQGNIYYLDRTLRVTRGEIRFENISTLDPELDILAELPVLARNGEQDQLPERIILALSGTLNRPEFRFSSEPAVWDENDVITYLSLNVTPTEFDALNDREAVARYLSGRLLGLAQTQFTKQVRQWLAVDALRFESELTGGEGQRVTVGKYVGRNLYITYSQSFTGEMEPEFRVEYYLDRRNELVGERNEKGRFSLRYRHRLRY